MKGWNAFMKKLLFISILGLILIIPIIFISANVKTSEENLFGQNLKEIQNSTVNNVVATINGEKINGWEVAYLKWQYDNTIKTNSQIANVDTSIEGMIIKIAKEKLAIQEAKKIGIRITDEEINSIRKRQTDSYNKNINKNRDFIDGLGVSKEEVIEEFVIYEINSKIRMKFMKEFISSVNEGSFICNDTFIMDKIKNFKNYIKQSKENGNVNMKDGTEKIIELYTQYIDSLFDNSKYIIVK